VTGDRLTVLSTVEPDKVLTKQITSFNGEWQIEPYHKATWFAVRQVQVDGIVSLGRALAELERQPRSCVICGQPLPDINWARTRRLLYPQVDEDGTEYPATFEAILRRWLAIDFDDLPVPEWNPDDLARRREAILRDYAERNQPDGCAEHLKPWPLWDVDDEGDLGRDMAVGIAGDADPAPIDPVHDPELVCRTAVSTLPGEFHAASAWWQMTSSAGIKPGIRLRLWYWLDRPVSDEEAKRWLEASPVDRSLFNPIQAHYVAAPIFDPPELDPVPARSGWYWRLVDAVAVPALPKPPPPPTPAPPTIRRSSAAVDVNHHLARRTEAYADVCLRSVQTAPAGERHNTMRNVAITLFGMVEHGLLEEAAVWTVMISTADALRWDRRRADHLLSWCRAFAAEKRPLPKGFQ
jgi:hypothetical protein